MTRKICCGRAKTLSIGLRKRRGTEQEQDSEFSGRPPNLERIKLWRRRPSPELSKRTTRSIRSCGMSAWTTMIRPCWSTVMPSHNFRSSGCFSGTLSRPKPTSPLTASRRLAASSSFAALPWTSARSPALKSLTNQVSSRPRKIFEKSIPPRPQSGDCQRGRRRLRCGDPPELGRFGGGSHLCDQWLCRCMSPGLPFVKRGFDGRNLAGHRQGRIENTKAAGFLGNNRVFVVAHLLCALQNGFIDAERAAGEKHRSLGGLGKENFLDVAVGSNPLSTANRSS